MERRKKLIRSPNSVRFINTINFSGFRRRNIMFYCISDPRPVGELADITVMLPNSPFYLFHGVLRGGDASGIKWREHGQVVEVITRREDLAFLEAELSRHFSEGGPFVVSLMAKTGIHIITDDREVWDAPAIFIQISVDDIRIPIAAGN